MNTKLTILIMLLLAITSVQCLNAKNKKETECKEIINRTFTKGIQNTNLGTYMGTLLLHGFSEYVLVDSTDLNLTLNLFEKYGTGDIEVTGNFNSYEAGGSGAPLLSWKGKSQKLDHQILIAAETMMTHQKRSPEGLMTASAERFANHQIFIDVAFGVTPFLLYSGLKFKNNEYIDFAVFETLELFKILKDKNTGLVHQGRGFQGEGVISQDNWSRGNGWGAFALSLLVRDLPDSHPQKREVIELAKQFFTDLVKFQDKNGMWHQEITDHDSYVETSGTGLILFGLGIMLEKKHLPEKYLKNFKQGLQGYLDYIGKDGSVSNTCKGNLCPGDGTKEDYKKIPWVLNDSHAFGPVILAFTQALKLGIEEVKPLKRLGFYVDDDLLPQPGTFVMQARGSDLAWENDRVAFRVYGPSVRDKVKSGVDVWAKSVSYPILEKWYKLSQKGIDYHTDRGEGCDFYNVGKETGCGGLGVWIEEKIYVPETFDSCRIIQNNPDKIKFELKYDTWNIPGLKIREHKIIEMGLGSNLFKVTSTIQSEDDIDLIVAIGLTTNEKSAFYEDEKRGTLSVWDDITDSEKVLGLTIIANQNMFAGYKLLNNSRLILLKVKTNIPFTYYSGATWNKGKELNNKKEWFRYVKNESKNKKNQLL